MKYYVGAYAASPNQSAWNPELETAYYDALKQLSNVRGLEHPFLGKLHAQDDDWFLANIKPDWDFVFTCIPGIMNALSQNPQFGLASEDENGRQAALSFMRQACEAIAKLNRHLGRNAVQALMLQSAPARNNAASSAKAFQASLETMLQWDWQGARLVVEHCDAWLPSHTPSKGFLALQDELDVIKRLNANAAVKTPMGMVVNWGRSVFETRRVDGAAEHIAAAQQAGVLAGVMFSGVSDKDSEYGAWRDSHQPAQSSERVKHGEAGSWMTEQAMQQCLATCDKVGMLPILGIKIGIRPHSATIDTRLGYIGDTLAILDRYFNAG